MKEREREKEKKKKQKTKQKKKQQEKKRKKNIELDSRKVASKRPWRCLLLPFFLDFAINILGK